MAERNTLQKSLVYGTLCKLANHPTADDVYAAIHAECPSVSRATVYRVLNRLAEHGEVLKVKVNSGADHFDHQTFPHYHVTCSVCGNMCDVDLPYIDGLDHEIHAASGYRITGYTIQFDGVCPACTSKTDAKE